MQAPELDTELPAGNIRLLGQAGDSFTLAPDLRDTEGFWFYWKFRVRGAAGRRLTFRFEGGGDDAPACCVGARGPAVSRDRGASWTWLSDTPDAPEDHFRFNFAGGDDEVWFSMCLPYGVEEWESFTAEYRLAGQIRSLCTTPGGTAVPLLELDGSRGGPAVLLTARHHCCETPANFVMEGFIRRWLDLAPGALWAIPFMDMEGVLAGDQGKNRKGADHNRDYGPGSRYAEVRALKALIRREGAPRVAFDLHAPYIRYGINERVYFPGPEDSGHAAALARFAERLEARARGLPFRAADNLPYGEGWNGPQNYAAGLSSSKWMQGQSGCRLAVTLEVPYANAAGRAVLPERARTFGASMAEVLAEDPEFAGRR
ncbi:MAG: hypothetical protein ACLFS1_09740 [Opitutales bacterium]